jgi:DNA-directed RNA polymerase III subunit RPC11
MLFCPTCGNLLLIEKTIATYRFYCKTCPYICNINQNLKNYTKFEKKQVDSIFGGKEAWENVGKTDVTCPKCGNDKAYFKQIQIRSADEPSTLFYKCSNIDCAHDWREG